MGNAERDSTQDWVLPAERRPPTVYELEQRIDVALAVARAAEAAALEIGEAAMDSAEQARRAAGLAERASASIAAGAVAPSPSNGAEAGGHAEPEIGGEVAVEAEPEAAGLESAEDSLRHFTERADRVLARLRAIERLPQRIG